MRISEVKLRSAIRKIILEKEEVKNPGPYIKGARATTVKDDDGDPIDMDGDGVPNKADPKPKDGSIKEAGCGVDLMPVEPSMEDGLFDMAFADIPHPESYDLAMNFMFDNSGMISSTIESLMSLTGATCKKSFLMAVIDYFTEILENSESESKPHQIVMSLGGIGF